MTIYGYKQGGCKVQPRLFYCLFFLIIINAAIPPPITITAAAVIIMYNTVLLSAFSALSAGVLSTADLSPPPNLHIA